VDLSDQRLCFCGNFGFGGTKGIILELAALFLLLTGFVLFFLFLFSPFLHALPHVVWLHLRTHTDCASVLLKVYELDIKVEVSAKTCAGYTGYERSFACLRSLCLFRRNWNCIFGPIASESRRLRSCLFTTSRKCLCRLQTERGSC